MNPDPTITISVDYLVELSDDGKQPGQPEPEVILMPPAPQDTDSSSARANMPEQVPSLAEPKRRRKKR
jgi:hypothetical protein